MENQYPCADYKPGEDDLESFVYIRKFELDVNLDGYPGVSRVRGSNRYVSVGLTKSTTYVLRFSRVVTLICFLTVWKEICSQAKKYRN